MYNVNTLHRTNSGGWTVHNKPGGREQYRNALLRGFFCIELESVKGCRGNARGGRKVRAVIL
jgi:hypothetical protein